MTPLDEIDKLFQRLVETDQGILRVFLASEDGTAVFDVAGKLCGSTDGGRALAALGSAMHMASREQGADLGLGELHVVFCEFAGGNVVTAPCGEAVLSLVTTAAVSVEKVGRTMKLLVDVVGSRLREAAEQSSTPADRGDTRLLETAMERALRQISEL